jgi:cytosine/adenosine deaminase-related metal-dependent hydrolase/ubiquinone/menaquinone biosynthesis C-methylase UbiE
MSDTPVTRCFSSAEGYRLWSLVYDSQPNPMLSLERRYLEPLLPSIAGRDALDLGCGTGRWLEILASKSPHSLVGVDCSPEMLARAESKLRGRAILLNGNCQESQLHSSSADLLLCSFLISYVLDLDRFADEIQRIARPGADIFISDVHPQTETLLGWRRGFRLGDTHVDLATHTWPLPQLISSFERLGMLLVAMVEPRFGAPEFEVLQRAGKAGNSSPMRDYPAIYILQFKAQGHLSQRMARMRVPSSIDHLFGAQVAIGPEETVRADVDVHSGSIDFLGRCDFHRQRHTHRSSSLDLSGFLLLPGLINAHDHLEFALFPRLGNRCYENFCEWARDIHHPELSPVREHRAIPKETRLWWGGIRNLLAGVTTVCHHNPYQPEVFDRSFPIRVLRNFGWAHSLALDSGAASKFGETPSSQPFILHLGEGVDAQSAEEIFSLHRAAALDDRTVIVHGLALDERGVSLMKARGASLIWCPSSNYFLFGRTHSIDFIRAFPHVALGSDSSLTATGDLLDELRFARNEIAVPAEDLYLQVTSAAAEILRLQLGEGSIRIGSAADFIAIRDTGLSPADTLVACSYRDVELVVVAGRIHLLSSNLAVSLPSRFTDGLERLEIGEVVRWVRAPVAKLYKEAAAAVSGNLLLNGRPLRCAT